MYLLISTDGACRRNGKPDCVAAGGIFVQQIDKAGHLQSTHVTSHYEMQSTSQRGELLAMIDALKYTFSAMLPTQIVTDSEYIFNAITKDWVFKWARTGWLTATGEPIKNRDLWERIKLLLESCDEVMFYHLKGHCISIGAVTALALLNKSATGKPLLEAAYTKYDAVKHTAKREQLEKANELSERNNGFKLDPEKLRQFVVANTMADVIATRCVDLAASATLRTGSL